MDFITFFFDFCFRFRGEWTFALFFMEEEVMVSLS